MPPDNDPGFDGGLEDRVRRSLSARAGSTRLTDDAWLRIEARTGTAPGRARRPWFVLLAAGAPLALAAVIVAGAVLDDEKGRDSRVIVGPAAGGAAPVNGFAPAVPLSDLPTAPPPAAPLDGSTFRDRFTECGATSAKSAASAKDAFPGPGADEALQEFFAARIARDWERAQPLVTKEFMRRIGRDEFIGPSSPHVDRFTITDDLDRSPERLVVCVETYESTSADQALSGDRITVVREADGRWRVDQWVRGDPALYRQGVEGTIYFFTAPDAADCGNGDELLPVTVVVPAGPDADRRVVEELLSGPVGRVPEAALPPGSGATLLPPDVRIAVFSVQDGTAHLDLTPSADAGGGACLQTGRRQQVLRTLMSLPGIARAEITVGGKPADESFQP